MEKAPGNKQTLHCSSECIHFVLLYNSAETLKDSYKEDRMPVQLTNKFLLVAFDDNIIVLLLSAAILLIVISTIVCHCNQKFPLWL